MVLVLMVLMSRGEAQTTLQCDSGAVKVRAGVNTLPETLAGNTTYCLTESGVYTESDNQWRITNPNVKLQEASGVEAEMRGTIIPTEAADGFIFKGIYLDGSYGQQEAPRYDKCPLGCDTYATRAMFIDGADNFRLTGGFEITNRAPSGNTARAGQCILVTRQGSTGGVIEDGFVHHCGQIPRNNHEHAMFIGGLRNSVIRDMLVWEYADRGLQAYPNTNNVDVIGNVFAGGNSYAGMLTDGNATDVDMIGNVSAYNSTWNFYSGPESRGSGNDLGNNCFGPTKKVKTDASVREFGSVVANPLFDSSLADGIVKVTNRDCAAKLPERSRFRP
jgi:hypothetical protein